MKKTLKILLAAAMVAGVTLAFVGTGVKRVDAALPWLCKIQPAPTWAFLAVLLLTPLVGRFFCECLCPLGILQSLVNWLKGPKTHVRRVCTRLPETPVRQKVRWTVLALYVVLGVAGFGGLAWVLTPYSIFGKVAAGVAERNSAISTPVLAILLAVVPFAVVMALALIGKGRIWCNAICPMGTLFSLLSRKSLLCHKVGPGCANCRACFPKQPLKETPKEAAKDAPKEAAAETADGVTRREVLKGVALLAAAEAVEKTTDGGFADVSLPGIPPREASVLPPGAAPRATFGKLCVGCGLCIVRCPGKCLKPSTALKTFGQPEMDFRYGPCRPGCAYACAKACPAGALRDLGSLPKRDVHVGHAVWTRERCLRETAGVPCTACSRKCPYGAIHLVEGFPVVDRDKCTGCGACEHVCPARPLPAIHVAGLDRQRVVAPMSAAETVAEQRRADAAGREAGPSWHLAFGAQPA